jgi:hypothetical protein
MTPFGEEFFVKLTRKIMYMLYGGQMTGLVRKLGGQGQRKFVKGFSIKNYPPNPLPPQGLFISSFLPKSPLIHFNTWHHLPSLLPILSSLNSSK